MIEAREWGGGVEGGGGGRQRQKGMAMKPSTLQEKWRIRKERGKRRSRRTRIKTTQRAKLRCVGAQGFPAFFLAGEGAG